MRFIFMKTGLGVGIAVLSLLAGCGRIGFDVTSNGVQPDGSIADTSLPDGSTPDGSVPDGSVPDGSLEISCTDGQHNGDESDVDCGGSCTVLCETDQSCNGNGDCESGVCTNTVCQAPSCSDGVQNGDETSIDCGGGCLCAPPSWAKSFGNISSDGGFALVIDSNENLYVAGKYVHTVDFGGTSLNNPVYGAFLASYDKDGNLRWATDVIPGLATVSSLSIDSQDRVYVAMTAVNQATDIHRGYVQAFTHNGTLLWSRGLVGGESQMRGAATDAIGAVYTVGRFEGSVDFGNGIPLVSNAGSQDIFVVSYDNDTGDLLWAQAFGSAQYEDASDIVAGADGAHCITGSYGGSFSFGGAALGVVGESDVFVVCFDSNGAHAWSKGIGSGEFDEGKRLAMSADGRLLVTGTFQDSINFGSGTGTLTAEGGNTIDDVFLVSYNVATGQAQWSRRLGGTQDDSPEALYVDDVAGSVVLIGAYQGTVDFGDAQRTSAGASDVYMIEYAIANGTSGVSHSFGNTGTDRGLGISGIAGQVVAFTGSFESTLTIDGMLLTSQGGSDIFIYQGILP